MLLVGALVIAAIVAVGFFAMNGSKPSSSAGPGHSGGLFGSAVPTGATVAPATPTQGAGGGVVTVKPSTFSCSDSSGQVTISVWLPASVPASEQVTGELDGVQVSTRIVGDTFEKQSDGRWLRSQTDSAASTCSGLEAGKHVYRVLDSQGNSLAQGSFTTTGAAATPTPGGGGGSLTVQPSSFSCSDTSTQVTMTVLLPASLSASAEVTAELDGETGSTESVGDNFTQQSDGRWLSTDTVSASDACSAYGAGKHTFSVLDAQGNVLATGSFTITAAATPTPTPASVGGVITIVPSTFSCSDTSVDVTISVWLAASVSSSEQVTAELDGQTLNTEAVGDGFTKQSDGRWFSDGTESAPALCGSLAAGKHILRVLDSQNKVLAQGSFTGQP